MKKLRFRIIRIEAKEMKYIKQKYNRFNQMEHYAYLGQGIRNLIVDLCGICISVVAPVLCFSAHLCLYIYIDCHCQIF